MSINPYEAPIEDQLNVDSTGGDAYGGTPVMLILLCVMTGLHFLVSAASTLVGLVIGNAIALGGGFVASFFYIAIFVGLIKRAEWARMSIIWMCYVSLITYLAQFATVGVLFVIPLMLLELITLAIAHNRRVREVTRASSVAKSYTYVDPEAVPPTTPSE